MDDIQQQRLQLLRVVGTKINGMYALANVDIGFEEWRSHLFRWDGVNWSCIYIDPEDFCVECILTHNGSIGLARNDGIFIVVDDNSSVSKYQTSQYGGFVVQEISPNQFLFAGSSIEVMNLNNGHTKVFLNTKHEWNRLTKRHNTIAVVGEEGLIVLVENERISFVSIPNRTRLTSVYLSANKDLIVGGWKGVIYRQTTDGWQNISIQTDAAVTDLAMQNTTLLACAKGLYTCRERSFEWQCEINPNRDVWSISCIGKDLLACHTYEGLIARWNDGRWQEMFRLKVN